MNRKCLVLLAAMLFIPTGALADVEGNLAVEVIKRAAGGSDTPAVIFKAMDTVRNLTVDVTKTGGETLTYSKKAMSRGESWKVAWPQAPGRAYYRVEYNYDGLYEPQSIAFSAAVAEDFDIQVTASDIDLDAGHIGFTTRGKVTKVQVWLFAVDGKEILKRELRMDLPSGPYKGLEYPVPAQEIGLVKVVAVDPTDFTKELTFTPISMPVPHDEVNFEFGKADVRAAEEPKLEKVLAETEKAVANLGKQIQFKLFVAGYTDTVGSHEANIELSRKRAESIAGWLRGHGMKLPVCSKGFGETVLAVSTPDETQNEQNRRTIFVIAGQAPYGKDFPENTGWNCR
jgi:outer membrane protein OmpA-like peptidoglycan-associated protein